LKWCEGNDALMEEYFDKGTLPVGTPEDARPIEMRMYWCRARRACLPAELMNFIAENFPAPGERGW
jgi:hypothetical protein